MISYYGFEISLRRSPSGRTHANQTYGEREDFGPFWIGPENGQQKLSNRSTQL